MHVVPKQFQNCKYVYIATDVVKLCNNWSVTTETIFFLIFYEFKAHRCGDVKTLLRYFLSRNFCPTQPGLVLNSYLITCVFERTQSHPALNNERINSFWHVATQNLGIINWLSHARYPAVIWTNADLRTISPLGINFSDICIQIDDF